MKCPFCSNKYEKSILKCLAKLLLESAHQRETIKNLLQEITKMSLQMDTLNAQLTTLVSNVAAEGNAVIAATAAIKGLTDQQASLNQQLLDAIAAQDLPGIQAAADAMTGLNTSIVAQTDALAAAIPATPAV